MLQTKDLCANFAKSRAMDHVFGYTIVNDVTARDVQVRHQQWELGKSFDTFCPMGPWLVTADELDGRDTRVRGWVNGELRQDARTKDMIFDIPTLIETCSRGITLYPGDVIATGTPSGVGMGFSPPRWLAVRRDGRSMIYTARYDTMNGLIAFLTENCCQGAQDADAPATICKPARGKRAKVAA